jgi:hypothetical protein
MFKSRRKDLNQLAAFLDPVDQAHLRGDIVLIEEIKPSNLDF